jgi:hypothetical protein
MNMKQRASRAITGVAIMVSCSRCGTEHLPTAASPAIATVPPASQQAPARREIPLTGTPTVYGFSGHIGNQAVESYTTNSTFRLYADGAFVLQYELGSYAGTYRQNGDQITFEFLDDSRWNALGLLQDDVLEVHYSWVAGMSGFDDAKYKLTTTPN